MPCYYDTPDSDNQIEIEKRAKVRMYFDVQELMTDDQIKQSHEMNISKFPLPDENTALCKLCSILNKEQLQKISAYMWNIEWKHKTLYDWYVQHCKDDIDHNKE